MPTAVQISSSNGSFAGEEVRISRSDRGASPPPGPLISAKRLAFPPLYQDAMIATYEDFQSRLLARSSGSGDVVHRRDAATRSEEHTSELQSLMRISYAVFGLKKTNKHTH